MSIPSWAKVGAKVVCVDGEDTSGALLSGVVYTVDGISGDRYGVFLHIEAARLNDATDGNAWLVSRFRPVSERTAKDDISEHFAVYLKTPVRTSIRAGERA